MSKKQFLLLIMCACCMLNGCNLEDSLRADKIAASVTAHNLHAKSYKLEKGFLGQVFGKGQCVELEFSDFEGVPQNYAPYKLTSSGALSYISNLNAEAYKNYDKLTVTVNLSDTTYRQTYTVSDIELVREHVKQSASLVSGIVAGYSNSVINEIDTGFLQLNKLATIDSTFQLLENKHGKYNRVIVTGFDVGDYIPKKIPIYAVYYQLMRVDTSTEAFTYTDLRLTIDKKSGKVLDIAINAD